MHGVGMKIQVPCRFEVDNYLGQREDPEAEVTARHHFYYDGRTHVERRHRHEFLTLPLVVARNRNAAPSRLPVRRQAFAATFTKRSNGSLRTMRSRLSVHPFPLARTDTQPRSLPLCGDSYMRTPMCLPLQLAGVQTIATAPDSAQSWLPASPYSPAIARS